MPGSASHSDVTRGADRQSGRVHSSAFEAEQNLAPALRGLARPVLDCQEPLLAAGGDANNYKRAKLVILAPKATVDAVSPDLDDWLVIERSVFPAVTLLGPFALETRDRIRRQPTFHRQVYLTLLCFCAPIASDVRFLRTKNLQLRLHSRRQLI